MIIVILQYREKKNIKNPFSIAHNKKKVRLDQAMEEYAITIRKKIIEKKNNTTNDD